MFHEVKGNNICVDASRKTASWKPVQTGGLVFTDTHITHTQSVLLKLEGSGAVELGVISYEPSSIQDSVPESASKLKDYVFLNDVKIHKRTCTMVITLNTGKKEIHTSYGGGHYRQEVDCNKFFWLVADVKYGQVEMTLSNEDNQIAHYQFSDICGNNIKRLNDPCQACSLKKSPASYCLSNDDVVKDNQYVIRCSPHPYQGTVPGRFYITLYYTWMRPDDFYKKHTDKFDVLKQECNQQATSQDLIEIEKFEKEDCTGNPILISYDGKKITHKSATGKRGSHHIHAGNTQLRFVFELYGVSATLDVIDMPGDVMGHSGVRPIMSDIPEDSVSNTDATDAMQCSARIRNESCIDDPVCLEEPIRKNFTTLRDSFTVDEFIDNMYEQNLLTEKELTEIGKLCEKSKHQATKQVLIRLSYCQVSKKFMIDALEKTKQSYLCKYFFPTDEKE